MLKGLRPITVVLAALATAVTYARLTGIELEFGPWFGAHGFLTPSQVWTGAWWGYLTSVFPHGDWIHLAFNLYWLWLFGSVLEDRLGSASFLGLTLVTAYCASGLQFTVTGVPGIGLSGVGYGLFGYAWMRSRFDRTYQLDPNVVKLFVAWFFIAILLDEFGVMAIANWAHGGGALSGGLIAVAFHAPRLSRALAGALGIGLLVASSTTALFWQPWNERWLHHTAEVHLDAGRYDEALGLYEELLVRDPDDPYALHNRAYIFQERGEHDRAAAGFRRARALDPELGR